MVNSKDLPDALHRLSEAHKNNHFDTETLSTYHQFDCACVDRDARDCFVIRYDRGVTDRTETSYSDTTKLERCECPCHDGFNDDDYGDF
jgi:hypothetical protein